MHPPLLAGILGLGPEELVFVFIGLVMVLALPISITAILLAYKNRQQQMWHETARLALEKGQPVPMPPPCRNWKQVQKNIEHNDLRGGLMMTAIGVGLWIFIGNVAAIMTFIGVAMLANGLITRRSDQKSGADDPPPQP